MMLYFTTVQLGSPPQNFNVQIDTGSDFLWVNCRSCDGCPAASGMNVSVAFFDPRNSSTGSLISCSDKRCHLGIQSSDSVCSAKSDKCSYTYQYGDGSATSGYYVSDLFHMMVYGKGFINETSAPVVFGCSISQTGYLTSSDRAIDGVFGLGRQGMSVVSQLASQGLIPNVFSHCFKGNATGGGVLVYGEATDPNIVFTPLVPSQPHYNIHLLSISVGGNNLPIDPSVFATSSTQGTIIDSGTTLAYVAESAYDPLIFAITTAVAQYVRTFVMRANQCYSVPSSIKQVFPDISFNFAGGASMVLKPEDYLVPQNVDGKQMWCVGLQKSEGQEITILGDIALKDKVVVYDLANQRIGWAPYDCSVPMKFSERVTNRTSQPVKSEQLSGASSLTNLPGDLLIQITTIILLVHMFTLGNCLFY